MILFPFSVCCRIDKLRNNFGFILSSKRKPYSVIEKAIGLKASTGEAHHLTLETLRKLPDSLYNPVMVLDSDTKNSLEIYTLLADENNHPVMIALRLDEKEMRSGKKNTEYTVNSIRSIYGKENHNTAISRLQKGYGRYINMKLAALYETAFGVQFPGASSIKNSSKYIIIDESPDVKSENEKNQEKSGIFTSPGENVRFSIRQEPPPQKI